MPEITLYDTSNNIVCKFRLSKDILGLDYDIMSVRDYRYFMDRHQHWGSAGLYRRGSLGVLLIGDQNQLFLNDQRAQNMAADFAAAHQAAGIRQLSFAGIKVGMSLRETFQILHAAGYIEENLSPRFAPIVWNSAYRFSIKCFRPTYNDVLRNNNIVPCSVAGGWSGLKFHRKDSNGTEYDIKLGFTEFATPTRTDALENARVEYVSGHLSLKESVGQAYYEKLAHDKYGDALTFHQRISGHQFDYPYGEGESDEINIKPEADGLSVEFESSSYMAEQRDILYENMLKVSQANSRAAPKPVF